MHASLALPSACPCRLPRAPHPCLASPYPLLRAGPAPAARAHHAAQGGAWQQAAGARGSDGAPGAAGGPVHDGVGAAEPAGDGALAGACAQRHLRRHLRAAGGRGDCSCVCASVPLLPVATAVSCRHGAHGGRASVLVAREAGGGGRHAALARRRWVKSIWDELHRPALGADVPLDSATHASLPRAACLVAAHVKCERGSPSPGHV